jgi:hypothetical protein
MSSFSGVHVDQEFDPLQSEPKKFKMGNDEFPSNDCEYVASRAHSLKRHVEIKHIEKTYSLDGNYFALRAILFFLKIQSTAKLHCSHYP